MKLTPKKSIDAHSISNFLLDRTSQCGGCEPNGKWWNLAELFAFSNGSSIDPEAFRSLVSGSHPDHARLLLDLPADHSIQITFRADPSLSALWARSDPQIRAELEECHQEAVARSLERVEWTECAFQEPAHQRFLPTPADILGALFHHTSNGEAPDLHTHCVIIGAARARESRVWGRLDLHSFNDQIDRGATVYQQELMTLLGSRLAIASERYGHDENGPHYRILGGPLDWLMPTEDIPLGSSSESNH